jgi:chorismate synthase
MAGNSFGQLFRITTWGESHGPAVGVIVDGCPARLELSERTIQQMLDRRRPGSGPTSTTRGEGDRARILSGVFDDRTTGTPIAILVENRDANPAAYAPYADLFRPGHGDITYQAKYGIRDWRGGGRSSARETVGRVAGGAVAGVLLKHFDVRVIAYTRDLGGVRIQGVDLESVDRNPFGSPDPGSVPLMAERVASAKKQGDSIGGVVEIVANGVPAGLGEPVFDKLDADLAKGLMSIGAVKGVEIGSGFKAASIPGSEHNDPITEKGYASNHAGGILAGISNGDQIVIRAAVKPIPSIRRVQRTIDAKGQARELSVTGRHDVAAIPRVNVVCEAMVNLVLADHLLRQRAGAGSVSNRGDQPTAGGK